MAVPFLSLRFQTPFWERPCPRTPGAGKTEASTLSIYKKSCLFPFCSTFGIQLSALCRDETLSTKVICRSMKTLISLLAVLCMLAPISIPALADSAQDFLNSVKTAIQEKNSEKLDALTYTAGMSDSDKQVMDFGHKSRIRRQSNRRHSVRSLSRPTHSLGWHHGRTENTK